MVSNETQERYKNLHTNEWYENLPEHLTKECCACHKQLPIKEFSKHRKQADGFTYRCKKCVRIHNYRNGVNLAYTKYSAKRRNMDFNLTLDDLFLPEYCPILGIKLDYFVEGGAAQNSPSIDRIDNSKGYVKGNVIIMSRIANAMKNDANFTELENFCKNMMKLVNHYKIEGALGNVTDIFPDSKERSLDSSRCTFKDVSI